MAIVTKEQMQALRQKRNKLYQDYQHFQQIIEGLQEICQHDWKTAGHDSHYEYRICKICQKKERI